MQCLPLYSLIQVSKHDNDDYGPVIKKVNYEITGQSVQILRHSQTRVKNAGFGNFGNLLSLEILSYT